MQLPGLVLEESLDEAVELLLEELEVVVSDEEELDEPELVGAELFDEDEEVEVLEVLGLTWVWL